MIQVRKTDINSKKKESSIMQAVMNTYIQWCKINLEFSDTDIYSQIQSIKNRVLHLENVYDIVETMLWEKDGIYFIIFGTMANYKFDSIISFKSNELKYSDMGVISEVIKSDEPFYCCKIDTVNNTYSVIPKDEIIKNGGVKYFSLDK